MHCTHFTVKYSCSAKSWRATEVTRKRMGLEFEPAFIQEVEHRPKPAIPDAGSIPLIDLSPLLTTPIPNDGDEIPEALQDLVAEVEAACTEWGFFQVINHGVPLELLERVQSAAKDFFALPMDEKRRVRRDEENPLGYYDTEHTKNVRDWKEVFDFVVNEPVYAPGTNEQGETRLQEIKNQWPEYPPQMR